VRGFDGIKNRLRRCRIIGDICVSLKYRAQQDAGMVMQLMNFQTGRSGLGAQNPQPSEVKT
jgi:hypothetical protein